MQQTNNVEQRGHL